MQSRPEPWMLDQQPRIERAERRRAVLQAVMLLLALLAAGTDLEPLLRWVVS